MPHSLPESSPFPSAPSPHIPSRPRRYTSPECPYPRAPSEIRFLLSRRGFFSSRATSIPLIPGMDISRTAKSGSSAHYRLECAQFHPRPSPTISNDPCNSFALHSAPELDRPRALLACHSFKSSPRSRLSVPSAAIEMRSKSGPPHPLSLELISVTAQPHFCYESARDSKVLTIGRNYNAGRKVKEACAAQKPRSR